MTANDVEAAGNLNSRPSSAGADYRDPEDDAIEDIRTTSVYASLGGLFNSAKFSDMTIFCGGRHFKAHRAIVCTQSSFFDKALTRGFAEAATGVVNLPEDDPDVLERFLQFLYTGNYEDETHPAWTKPADVTMLSPEKVAVDLSMAPGVHVPVRLAGATTRVDGTANGDGDGSDDDKDGSYEPELSHGEPIEPEEPAEEYNEFDEDDIPREEEDEHEDGDNDAPLVTRLNQLLDELGDSEKAERQFLHELCTQHNLFLPLRLYVMADKFDVPALKLLARDRFYRAAELSWRDLECFPTVVDELYTCTPSTDVAMRDIVCRLVGSDIESSEQRERMDWVMRKHGDFAVGVMNYMIQSNRMVWTED